MNSTSFLLSNFILFSHVRPFDVNGEFKRVYIFSTHTGCVYLFTHPYTQRGVCIFSTHTAVAVCVEKIAPVLYEQ